MELTKEQAIEILEAALANPDYLRDEESIRFFCSSVSQVIEAKSLCYKDEQDTFQFVQDAYIYPSINNCLFLKSYLIQQGIIPSGTCYTDPVYKIAARNHWATLIKRLKGDE